MNNANAIAIVSNALVLLLQNAINQVMSGASVYSRHPRDMSDSDTKKAGVNLYLYQVAPNAAWRNVEVNIRPKKSQPGDDRRQVVRVPVVPINLYYMISFYGDERTYEPHRLLSAVLPALHMATSRLPRHLQDAADNIARIAQPPPRDDSQNPDSQGAKPRQLSADEQDAVEEAISTIEKIKLNPVQLNLEELSKLWSVFFQVPYALSVAYEASVVLLATGDPEWTPVATTTALNRPGKEAPGQAPGKDAGKEQEADEQKWLRREREDAIRREPDPWRDGTRAPEEEPR